MKVGDLVRFGAGAQGIVVKLDKGYVTITTFDGFYWTARQDETEIISEAQ